VSTTAVTDDRPPVSIWLAVALPLAAAAYYVLATGGRLGLGLALFGYAAYRVVRYRSIGAWAGMLVLALLTGYLNVTGDGADPAVGVTASALSIAALLAPPSRDWARF
jgi:hypothetical protein